MNWFKLLRIQGLSTRGLLNWIPDEVYLKYAFKSKLGYDLNLENPQTFNEKLQWLKLYDRRPEYTVMVDKYLAKQYVADKIGEQYIIPTLGVWDSPDEIDFDKLPDQFVLKCNHNSGLGMCICRNKSELDIKKVKSELRKGIKQNYYLGGREWSYKNVPRKIIGEKYMGDDLNDYKLMCFNGKVKCSFVCSERNYGLHVTFFDNDWNKLPFERHYPASDKNIPKPQKYDEMVSLAEKLSSGIPFVRVDFYEINGHIFFGELTFYPGSGFEEFTPIDADYLLGSYISLSEIRS